MHHSRDISSRLSDFSHFSRLDQIISARSNACKRGFHRRFAKVFAGSGDDLQSIIGTREPYVTIRLPGNIHVHQAQ